MRILIQRVKSAKVVVEGHSTADIKHGLLLFVGVGRDDAVKDIERLSTKVMNLRIFEDEQGKMNLNIKQLNGRILSVDRKSTRLNSSHIPLSRMPSSA